MVIKNVLYKLSQKRKSSCKEESIESGLCINKLNPNSNPKLLKLKVSHVSKGTLEPIDIKIK